MPLLVSGVSLLLIYMIDEVPRSLFLITLFFGWVSVQTSKGAKFSIWLSLLLCSLWVAIIVLSCLTAIWDIAIYGQATMKLKDSVVPQLGGGALLGFFLWLIIPKPQAVFRYCLHGSSSDVFAERSHFPDARDLPKQNPLQLLRLIGWKRVIRSMASLVLPASVATVFSTIAFFTIRAGLWKLAIGSTFVVVEAMRRGWRRAKPNLLRTAVQTQIEDRRSPVLLLRSFQDDEIWLTPPADPIWRWLVPYLGPRRLEELLAEELWAIGPVLAIGKPGEALPLLGAARDYLSDDRWKNRVQDLIHAATVIVVIMGNSSGLEWEYHTLAQAGALDRVMLVIPPTSDATLAARWQSAQVAFESKLELGIPDAAGHIIVHGEQGPCMVTSVFRDVESYRLALAIGMGLQCSRT
jgi:hypothetical protein